MYNNPIGDLLDIINGLVVFADRAADDLWQLSLDTADSEPAASATYRADATMARTAVERAREALRRR